MGTVSKRFLIPTDADISITGTSYRDLEDCGEFAEEARRIASPDSSTADMQDIDALRVLIEESVCDDIQGIEIDDIDINLRWNFRSVDVCEWCDSAGCDGDEDSCDEVPVCDNCEEFRWNCTCDSNGEEVVEDTEDTAEVIRTKDGDWTLVVYGPEEEAVL